MSWIQRDLTEATLNLARMIEQAKHHKVTAAERREQRISFVYGQMKGDVTREEVAKRLAEIHGWEDPNQ